MKTLNRIKKAAGLTLGVLIALLFITPCAKAQTNGQLTNSYSGPYYSITNLLVSGTQSILVNDPAADTAVAVIGTNNYTAGTNYQGGNVYPAGIKNSLNVAFGLVVNTTNIAAKGIYIATIQGGTGYGDWTTLGMLPCSVLSTPIAPTSIVGTVTNNVYATNATYNVGGFLYFRCSQITINQESNYNATVSLSMSAKPGI